MCLLGKSIAGSCWLICETWLSFSNAVYELSFEISIVSSLHETKIHLSLKTVGSVPSHSIPEKRDESLAKLICLLLSRKPKFAVQL